MANRVDLLEVDKLAEEVQNRITSLSNEATQAKIADQDIQKIAQNTFAFYKNIYGNKGGARMFANLDAVKKSSKYAKAINTIAANYRSIKIDKLSTHLNTLKNASAVANDPALQEPMQKNTNYSKFTKTSQITK